MFETRNVTAEISQFSSRCRQFTASRPRRACELNLRLSRTKEIIFASIESNFLAHPKIKRKFATFRRMQNLTKCGHESREL
jgi:hypothetical protein